MDQPLNAAQAATIEYLTRVEQRLNFEPDVNGVPRFSKRRVNAISLQRLDLDLRELLDGRVAADSIDATRNESSKVVHTLGYGLVDDFDTFIKVGLLCGERVVLWDYLWGRLLADPQAAMGQLDHIGNVAENVVRLRPLAEAGGLVMLPFIEQWSPLAARRLMAVREIPDLTDEAFGLTGALAAREADLGVSPYTLRPTRQEDPDLSLSQAYFHHALADLVLDDALTVLTEATPERVYRTMSVDADFRDALRSVLLDGVEGMPPAQVRLAVEDRRARLVGAWKDRNGLNSQNAGTATTILGFAAAGVGVATASGVLAGLGVGLGLVSELIKALKDWKDPSPQQGVLQVFRKLNRGVTVDRLRQWRIELKE